MTKFLAAGIAAAVFAVPATAGAQAFVQLETGFESVSQGGEAEHGLGYGVTAGYDVPLKGGLFIGVQGTVADSTTDACTTITPIYARASNEVVCSETGRDLSALVRLGARVGAKNKLYVLGGYTNARIRTTYSYDYEDSESTRYASNGDGLRLGAGFERELTSRFFAKAEYRYSNYEQGVSRHNALVALGAKF